MSDKIYIVSESGFFGGSLEDAMVNKVRRIPGVFDALWCCCICPMTWKALECSGLFVVGIPYDKQELTLRDIKTHGGEVACPGDSYRAVIGSNVVRQYGLDVGDEIEIKSKRVAARVDNNQCKELYSCWCNGIHKHLILII